MQRPTEAINLLRLTDDEDHTGLIDVLWLKITELIEYIDHLERTLPVPDEKLRALVKEWRKRSDETIDRSRQMLKAGLLVDATVAKAMAFGICADQLEEAITPGDRDLPFDTGVEIGDQTERVP